MVDNFIEQFNNKINNLNQQNILNELEKLANDYENNPKKLYICKYFAKSIKYNRINFDKLIFNASSKYKLLLLFSNYVYEYGINYKNQKNNYIFDINGITMLIDIELDGYIQKNTFHNIDINMFNLKWVIDLYIDYMFNNDTLYFKEYEERKIIQ